MREALQLIDADEVYIVPDFISEGYFTQDIIPREFGLTGPTTEVDGKTLHYTLPVGVHPSMTGLILRRAKEVAPDAPPANTTLIITGHGTGLNQNSTKAIRDQVEQIIASGAGYHTVTDAFMEEPPFIAEWDTMSPTENVVVVPFFISDGLHSYQDIPVLLGIESEVGAAASQREVFRHNPHHLRGKTLYYSSAIGTERLIADVILDQIHDFDETHQPSSPEKSGEKETISGFLSSAIAGGVHRIGEIEIRREGDGFILCHHEDTSAVCSSDKAGLELHQGPDAARDISTYSEAGEYRFNKSEASLRRGWAMVLSSVEDLRLALDQFYPAAVGVWKAFREERLPVQNLREKLERQTGMYRSARFISTEGAQATVAAIYGPGKPCSQRILWQIDAETPVEDEGARSFNGIISGLPESEAIPLISAEPCNHLVSECRKVSKAEYEAKTQATSAT
jgi:sirohydrochlorin cobaltochelatase